MRLLIDTLGAPERSGGMRLYAEELVKAWAELDLGDELHVVGYPWTSSAFEGHPVRVHEVPETVAIRIAGQWLYTPYVARRIRADAVLSVSLVASPLVGNRPRLCTVHDWRHLVRPEEFGWLQRAYRRSWVWSTNHADLAIQISHKTDEETARIAPRARRAVVENGQDHARRWPVVDIPDTHERPVVTFGHHANKRPDLVIRALAEAFETSGIRTQLTVLGARGEYADELSRLGTELGLDGWLELPGFVEEEEYQRRIQGASAIVLASTDEGFGLPVSEGAYFGITVISTDDNGIDRIHGDRATVVPPTSSALAEAMNAALVGGRLAGRLVGNTWRETAVQIRTQVLALVKEQARPDTRLAPGAPVNNDEGRILE